MSSGLIEGEGGIEPECLMKCLLLCWRGTGSESSKSTMKELKRCCDGERQAIMTGGRREEDVGVGDRDGPR